MVARGTSSLRRRRPGLLSNRLARRAIRRGRQGFEAPQIHGVAAVQALPISLVEQPLPRSQHLLQLVRCMIGLGFIDDCQLLFCRHVLEVRYLVRVGLQRVVR